MEATYRGPLHRIVDTTVGHTLFFQKKASSKTDEKIKSLLEWHDFFKNHFGGKEIQVPTSSGDCNLSGFYFSARKYRKMRGDKGAYSSTLKYSQIIEGAPRIQKKSKTVILTNGAGQLFEYFSEYFINFLDRGFNIIVFNYSGHGLSEGEPSEGEIYNNVQDVYRHAISQLGIPKDELIGAGFSLGGATILSLVDVNPSIPLILERTFSSMEHVFAGYAPRGLKWMARGLSNRYLQFNSLEKIKKATGPILITRAEKDEIIPFDCASRLFEASVSTSQAGQKMVLLDVSGYHNFDPDHPIWVHNPEDQKEFDKALRYLDLIDIM